MRAGRPLWRYLLLAILAIAGVLAAWRSCSRPGRPLWPSCYAAWRGGKSRDAYTRGLGGRPRRSCSACCSALWVALWLPARNAIRPPRRNSPARPFSICLRLRRQSTEANGYCSVSRAICNRAWRRYVAACFGSCLYRRAAVYGRICFAAQPERYGHGLFDAHGSGMCSISWGLAQTLADRPIGNKWSL